MSKQIEDEIKLLEGSIRYVKTGNNEIRRDCLAILKMVLAANITDYRVSWRGKNGGLLLEFELKDSPKQNPNKLRFQYSDKDNHSISFNSLDQRHIILSKLIVLYFSEVKKGKDEKEVK